MPQTIHVLDLVDQPDREIAALNVLFGEEPYLKQLGRQLLRDRVLPELDQAGLVTVLDGATIEWRDFNDELSAYSLFGGGNRRLVIVEQADAFVSQHRARLESYLGNPSGTSCCVLEVGSWPSNTRLYKQLDKQGLQVDCNPPMRTRGKRKSLDEDRVRKWLRARAETQHQVRLDPAAAEQLLDISGPAFGLLDQELAKLALYISDGGTITEETVREIVGGWRAKTVWELVDAAASGNSDAALLQLDRLLQSGEHPLAIFGQLSWSLRRFDAATRIIERSEADGRPVSLPDALLEAGFRRWPADALAVAERQLRQLGRARSGQLSRWLLEVDLGMKGSHSSPARARLALELLLVRMSREAKQMHQPAVF